MPCHNACFSRAAPHPPRPLFLTLFGVLLCVPVAQFFSSSAQVHLLWRWLFTVGHVLVLPQLSTAPLTAWFRRARANQVAVSQCLVCTCSLSLLVQWILAFGLARDEDVRQSPAVPSARPCTCTAQPITRRMPSRQSSGPGPGPDLMRTRSARGYGRHDCTRSIRAFSCHSTVKFAF